MATAKKAAPVKKAVAKKAPAKKAAAPKNTAEVKPVTPVAAPAPAPAAKKKPGFLARLFGAK
jgi:valyl-tRNA synthetase